MIVRNLRNSDWDIARTLHEDTHFDFKWPENMAHVAAGCVIEDDAGDPMAVCAAKLQPEIFIAMNQKLHPMVRIQALAMAHLFAQEAMAGYDEMFCFLPPELERGYGRHLQRHFGWVPTWKGYKLMKNHTEAGR